MGRSPGDAAAAGVLAQRHGAPAAAFGACPRCAGGCRGTSGRFRALGDAPSVTHGGTRARARHDGACEQGPGIRGSGARQPRRDDGRGCWRPRRVGGPCARSGVAAGGRGADSVEGTGGALAAPGGIPCRGAVRPALRRRERALRGADAGQGSAPPGVPAARCEGHAEGERDLDASARRGGIRGGIPGRRCRRGIAGVDVRA